MGMLSVGMRVNHETYDAVSWGTPKDRTRSAWIREMVETVVARPETDPRRRALMRLVDLGYREGRAPTSLRSKLTFRVEAEHWDALATLARTPATVVRPYSPPRPGMSRSKYFRLLVYVGSTHVRQWY